jgi:hypothetical protein
LFNVLVLVLPAFLENKYFVKEKSPKNARIPEKEVLF